jgi:hypothetical protein
MVLIDETDEVEVEIHTIIVPLIDVDDVEYSEIIDDEMDVHIGLEEDEVELGDHDETEIIHRQGRRTDENDVVLIYLE